MKTIFTILIFLSLTFAQVYDIGDTMSETHQNISFDVCYGDFGADTFHFADLNGALNGGDYFITFVDMSATW
ncbi:MAG: hypothetical protein ACE5D7_10095 [Fidelibacterota bacterium]